VKKRKSYSGQFKAKVLGEYLIGRRDLKEIADEYEVHPNQIKNWKCRLMKRAQLVLEDERRRGDGNPVALAGQAAVSSATKPEND
jgi:transposase